MQRHLVVLVAMGIGLGFGIGPVVASDDVCADGPSPKTCTAFVTFEGEPRWQYGPDGVSRTVDYYINPIQPWVPEEAAIAAIQAGFANWSDAAPNVRFHFAGLTNRPAINRDGLNIVAFTVDPLVAMSPLASAVTSWRAKGDWLDEMDTTIHPYWAWTWEPCPKEEGACTPLEPGGLVSDRWWVTSSWWPFGRDPNTTPVKDIENITTHEVGHWLGLGHPTQPNSIELTMSSSNSTKPAYLRRDTTLGLGDVLGARYLYPCECPLPAIVTP